MILDPTIITTAKQLYLHSATRNLPTEIRHFEHG